MNNINKNGKEEYIMKYMIERTSESSKKLPCEEAYVDTYMRIDERATNDPKKLNDMLDRNNWYKLGENHRVENGHIKRDFEFKGWFININSLDQLNQFVKTYGDIVIYQNYENPDILKIEIYDDYRE